MERAIVDASSRDDARSTAPLGQAEPSDGQLLDRLREGDATAYEELWLRHVGAARRAATRIAPTDQEDLVSEAFLAIYRQVRVDGKGPQTSFRAYLFTVMRNIAARWYREGRPFISDPEADTTVDEPGYELIDREHDARSCWMRSAHCPPAGSACSGFRRSRKSAALRSPPSSASARTPSPRCSAAHEAGSGSSGWPSIFRRASATTNGMWLRRCLHVS